MITEKLTQAKRTVQNMVDVNPARGTEWALWQYDMLVGSSDRDAAEALATWWMDHPKNPANQ